MKKPKPLPHIASEQHAKSILSNAGAGHRKRLAARQFLRAIGVSADTPAIRRADEARREAAHWYEPGTVCPDCGLIVSGLDDIDRVNFCDCDDDYDF